MFTKLPERLTFALAFSAVTLMLLGATSTSQAQCSHCTGHGGGSDDHPAAHSMPERQPAYQTNSKAETARNQATPPHGGQASATRGYIFEVVYQPQETRIYLYDALRNPLSARGIRGRAIMQVRENPRSYPFPASYVAPAAGGREQDYLAIAADVRQIRDGDMRVTFELADLPSGQESQATFTQTFALSQGGPTVTAAEPQFEASPRATRVSVAAATAADHEGIAQQQVCPVTGGRLGSMGTPLKVLIDGQRVYLCCRGCLSKVEQNPDAYLAKAAQLRSGR